MANRYFTQFMYSFFKKPVILAGKIPLSAAAAVGSYDIKGITSIAKTGAGTYLVTLDDKYFAVGSASCYASDSTQAIAVYVDAINLNAKTMNITTKVAGVVADVTDACDLYIHLLLSNSSIT